MTALIPVRFGRELLRLGEAPSPGMAFALVDDEDASLVLGYDWRYTATGGVAYATASGGPYTSMHGLIAAPPKGLLVHHVNGDGLDNRRTNLKVCTLAEHNKETHLPRTPGTPALSPERVRKLAAALGVDPSALYGEEG